MKQYAILTVTSLLSILLLTLHVADDIVRGISKAEPSNTALLVLVVFLYGTMVLRERRSGHVIMLLVGLFAAGMPVILASVPLLAAVGDARTVRSGMPRGGPRLARHLWRMCVALFIAAGSFFSIRERVAKSCRRDSAACGAVAQRSAGMSPLTCPKAIRGFGGISLESHRPLTVW